MSPIRDKHADDGTAQPGQGSLTVARLRETANSHPQLRRRGRYVSTTFLLDVGPDSYLVTVERGQVQSVDRGPFVMPTWTFALRAESAAWARFWSAAPPPGSHDLFAMIKSGALRVEGDLHPFMSNLFYFKMLMETLREKRP
jgi:hypothetical protein